jgi:hypothetical protein
MEQTYTFRSRNRDDEQGPGDPFREETGGPWHYSFRQGEMLFLGLTELPDVVRAIVGVRSMSKDDLESIVLERLYVWHAQQGGPPYLPPSDWLSPKPDSDS